MAASTGTTKFKITYEDGQVSTHKVKPRHLIALEDEVGEGLDIKSIRDGYKLAWLATDTSVPFDEWIKLVDDIDSDGEAPAATVELPDESTGEAEAVPTE